MIHYIDKKTYTRALKYTRYFVGKNSGSQDDADELLQEAVLVFLEKFRKGEITVKADTAVLLYNIARNMWLNILRQRKNGVIIYDLPGDIVDTGPLELQLKKIQDSFLTQVEEHLPNLNESCRIIIQGKMKGESFESIAKKMGINEIHKIWQRFHRCKNKLKEKINRNSGRDWTNEINELFDDE